METVESFRDRARSIHNKALEDQAAETARAQERVKNVIAMQAQSADNQRAALDKKTVVFASEIEAQAALQWVTAVYRKGAAHAVPTSPH